MVVAGNTSVTRVWALSSKVWMLVGALAPALLSAGLGSAQPAPQPPAGSSPAPPGQALSPPQPQPAQIDKNGLLILVRSTLLALHHANVTGNYTVLRDLGAPGFQAANSAARLGEVFARQRAQSLDLSGVAVLEPQLTVLPQIVEGGMMRMAGFFPSVPVQVNFELLFAPVNGQWRLFGLSLNVGQAAPAPAQSPPAQSQPTQAQEESKPAQAVPPPQRSPSPAPPQATPARPSPRPAVTAPQQPPRP